MAQFSGSTYSAAVDESKRLIALAMLGITKYEFDKTTNKLTLYMQDGTVVEAALTADSSSGTAGEAVEGKCIAPWKAGETYQKDVSLVIYNGYIYSCSVTNNDAVFTESHWTKLADNFDELTVDDVKAFLNLTPEQISKLSDIISTEIRLDKTFSSSDTYTRIQAAIDTAKEYTNNQLGKSVKPAYKVVSSTSEVTETGYFYLISNGTNFDMYVLSSDGSIVSLGTSEVDLSNYYTKTETDSDFLKKSDATSTYATITTVDGKLDKTNVLTAASTTATDDQVYSAKAMNTELNGVVKKTDISTTIDGTSTNDTVPTNKAVYDSLLNKVDNPITVSTADEVNNFDMAYQSFIIEPSVAEAVGLPKAPESTWFCINLSHFKGFKYPSQIAFEYAGIERIMYRTAHNGVWHNWRKIPTTSVVDVPKTNISSSNSNVTFGSHSCYSVVNGICYVSIWEFKGLTVSRDVAVATGMPKPKQITGTSIINANDSGNNVAFMYVDDSNSLCVNTFIPNIYGYGSFSYPVAE